MFRLFNQYVSAKSILLMIVEGVLILLSLVAAVKLRFWNNPAELSVYLALPDFAVQAGMVVVVCLACFYFNDHYNLASGFGPFESVVRVEMSFGAAMLLLGMVYTLLPS